jgi:hypothetical protein
MTIALLLLAVSASASSLVDNPIVGDQVTYLNAGWTATSSGGPSTACQFQEGLDWKPKSGSHVSGQEVAAFSKEDCCGKCLADSTCFVAVYVDQPKKSCWIKTEADASGGSYNRTGDGRFSCKKTSAEVDGPHAGHTIAGSVPGDLLTDLQKAGLIGDPLYELNFKNASIWNDYTWTYTTSFSITEEQLNNGAAEQVLVFDGIKMGARISVNGKLVGTAADQFLRYEFPLSSAGLLRAGANTLSVAFDPAIDVGGRFMSCTGGWDWAPYTNTFQGSAHTFSKGIWKSVYVVTVQSAAVTHVVPQIFYQGAYPTAPLTEGTHGGFSVDVNVHLWAPAAGAKGKICAIAGWGSSQQSVCAAVSAVAGNSVHTLNLTAAAKDVKLWWPAGVGAQPLYNIIVTFTASGEQREETAALTLSRRVGFRHFALVTGNDTDPSYVQKAQGMEGTDSNGMFFRVNGAVIFSKGANMIPMEELEGRMNAEAHTILVQSAVAGGMNTLRVWYVAFIRMSTHLRSCIYTRVYTVVV